MSEEEKEHYEKGKRSFKFWKKTCTENIGLCAEVLAKESCKFHESDRVKPNLQDVCKKGVKAERRS